MNKFIPIVVLAGGVLLSVKMARKKSAAVEDFNAALRQLNEGDVEQAAAALERLCHVFKGRPGWHACCVANRGVAYMRQGNIPKALQLLSSALKSQDFESKKWIVFAPFFAGKLAECLVDVGRVEEAQPWLDYALDILPTALRFQVLPARMAILAHHHQHEDMLALAREQAEGIKLLSPADRAKVANLQQCVQG